MALESGELVEGGSESDSEAGSDFDSPAVVASPMASVVAVSNPAVDASVVAAAVAPTSSGTGTTTVAAVVTSGSDAPANAAVTALVPAAAANAADPAIEPPLVLAWFDAVCLVAAVVRLNIA